MGFEIYILLYGTNPQHASRRCMHSCPRSPRQLLVLRHGEIWRMGQTMGEEQSETGYHGCFQSYCQAGKGKQNL